MMPVKEPQAEPSMEEILASIRRIISEEEGQGEPAAAPLELSEPAMDEPPASAKDDLLVFEEVEEELPPAPVALEPPPAPAPREEIVSPPAVAAAAGALHRLAGTLRIAETQGQTLEAVVRELLKPMLREWLDDNLPAIVEAKVEAELERIARLAR